jgi:ATP-dependent helicase/nuclease subunit B
VRIELVSPRPGLIAALAARLRPEGRDYSRTWIVFPEKRPAFYLRRALAGREGAPFIPPRTDSLDGFIDSLFKDILGRSERPIDPLDAIALLLEIHRESPVDAAAGASSRPTPFSRWVRRSTPTSRS